MVILVILLLVTLSSPIKVVSTIEDITQYNVNYHWDEVTELLNNLKSLNIKRGLTENSLHKILTSPLPKLQKLSVEQQHRYFFQLDMGTNQRQVLTQMLIKDVFTSEYFPKLKSLTLQQTNLDDKSFAFLEENITIHSELSDLNLGKNYISTVGLGRLSKIHFQKLVNLNLNNILLIQNQATDAVINIICQNQINLCPNQLESLRISDTHISRQSFNRLISKINTTTIKKIDISGMIFKFKQTLNQGFNYSAYEFLASQSFPSLETLTMNRQMNDDIGKIFQNWKLPNLKMLQINNHPIGNEGIMSWITKENMPKLQYLSIRNLQNIKDTTDITDIAFEHIVDQNFSLTYLDIGDTKLSNKGVLLCTKLLTPLKFLNLQNLKLTSTYLRILLIEMNLSNLEDLNLEDNNQISDLFQYFPWKKLQNLTILTLNKCDLVDSYQKLFQNRQVLLPNLKVLFIMNNDKTQNTLFNLFYYVPRLFPNIQQLYLSDYQFIPISYQKIEAALPFYKNGAKINYRNVQIIKSGYKFNIRALGRLVALFTQQMIQMTHNTIVSTMNRIFDFSQVEMLGFYDINEFVLFLQILKETQTYSLNNLTTFMIWSPYQATELIPLISQLSLPVLNALLCEIKIAPELDQTFLRQTIIPFFQKISSTCLNYDNEATSFRKILFDNLNYPFLQVIDVHTMDMEVNEIEQFIRVHSDTLRKVNVMADFFEKGFLQILVDMQITLNLLDLSRISFTPKQFSYLGKMNTGFLTDLALDQTDLTNEHIFALIEQKGSGPIFPNLKTLSLQGNDIRKQGLQLLMKSGLYSLKVLQMKYNNNPQFINILLKYPSKISVLTSEMDLYSIEPDLNPLSVAQIQAIVLKSNSFASQDFYNFGKLSFNRLQQYVIHVNNIYDCSVLKDLLNINMQANRGEFIFTNDYNGLNSSCLKDMTNYTSQMTIFGIEDKSINSYLPQFIELLLNTERNIKNIVLMNTRLPPATLSKIFSKNMHSISQIVLTNNYLDDPTFQQLMASSNFLELAILQLGGTSITDQSIKRLSNVKMPQLRVLGLSNINISWKSINYLTKLNAPLLQYLVLQGCELDGFSLQFIRKMKFQYLKRLDLSNNNFSEEELVEFVFNLDESKTPSLISLDLRGVALSKENYNAIQEFLKMKKLYQYQLSPPYNIKQVNSASY